MSMYATAMDPRRSIVSQAEAPTRPIPSEVEALEKHVHEFRALLEQLQGRLSPIVLPQPRLAEVENGTPAPPVSPLGQRLRGIAATVAEGNRLLVQLLDEIHV